ncbi:DNA-methyltransferase [Thermocrinis sp.]
MRVRRRKGTQTSSFGSSGRINHDSTRFYSRRIYEGIQKELKLDYIENQVPEEVLNKIFCKSSESMEELPDNSVHLVITSPPYNAGKEYDRDMNLQEYRDFLKKVWREVKRVLVSGGRVCINIANLGRKPYIPLHAYIIEDMLSLGFLMRGEIIWDKGSSAGSSTAWGSWMSAKNPVLRDVHEYILIFSKDNFSRSSEKKNTISREEFLEFTKSVWRFPPESAKRVGHPAPFPIELPYRLIQLYSFEGDVVLDPFMGSGQTAIACLKSKRYFVGYEIDERYVKLAEARIKDFLKTSKKLF